MVAPQLSFCLASQVEAGHQCPIGLRWNNGNLPATDRAVLALEFEGLITLAALKQNLAHWQRTESYFLAAEPDALFAVVGDLKQTGNWMKSFDGFMVHDNQRGVGSAVDLLPPGKVFGTLHRETAPAGSITRRNQQQRLVEFTQPQPGGAMVLRWVVQVVSGGSRLHFTVELTGPGTAVFKHTVANPLFDDFAINCARLYRQIPHMARHRVQRHVVVAGGRGFLGRRLVADLICHGNSVVVLTRSHEDDFPAAQFLWDGVHQGPWKAAFIRENYPVSLVNLAGELVDKRNTEANIELLTASRVQSTQALADAVAGLRFSLDTWVQSSTTAIYGDAGERRITESSPLPTGPDALPEMTGVAQAWEDAFVQAPVTAENNYVLRTSLVFADQAPLLKSLMMLVRTGLGGPIGDGQQWVSWISLPDWLALVRQLLGVEGTRPEPGVIHAAAPTPVRNAQMMQWLRQKYAMPGLGTPAALVRVGANVLGSNPRVALTGRHVTSQVLAEHCFEFQQPTFESLLTDLK